MFINPDFDNFTLAIHSPCINSGNPLFPNKSIGVNINYSENEKNRFIISEILFCPDSGSQKEFIELYNNTDSLINISGYSFSRGIDYIFPAQTTISAKSCIIVCADKSIYHSSNSNIMYEWFNGKLANEGECIKLNDNLGKGIDYVHYTISWPDKSFYDGASLELIDPDSDNSLVGSWRAYNIGGTPGAVNFSNSVTEEVTSCFMNCSYNPLNSSITIYFAIPENGLVKVFLYNVKGQLIKKIIKKKLPSKKHQYTFPSFSLANGIYIVSFEHKTQQKAKKLSVVN